MFIDLLWDIKDHKENCLRELSLYYNTQECWNFSWWDYNYTWNFFLKKTAHAYFEPFGGKMKQFSNRPPAISFSWNVFYQSFQLRHFGGREVFLNLFLGGGGGAHLWINCLFFFSYKTTLISDCHSTTRQEDDNILRICIKEKWCSV